MITRNEFSGLTPSGAVSLYAISLEGSIQLARAEAWQIDLQIGSLAGHVQRAGTTDQLLLKLAKRADIIVDSANDDPACPLL